MDPTAQASALASQVWPHHDALSKLRRATVSVLAAAGRQGPAGPFSMMDTQVGDKVKAAEPQAWQELGGRSVMKRVLDGAEPYLTRKQLPNNVSVASLDLDALAAAAAGGITAASGNGNGSGVSPQHQQGSAGGASNTGGGASAALLALGKPLNVNAPNFTLPTSAPAGANGTSPNAGGGSGGGGDAASNLPADLGVDEEFVSSALPDLSSPSPATGGLRILALAVYRPVGPADHLTILRLTAACLLAGVGDGPLGRYSLGGAQLGHLLSQAVPVAWSSLPSSGSRFSRLADTVISATPHKSNIAVRLDVHALEREALRAAAQYLPSSLTGDPAGGGSSIASSNQANQADPHAHMHAMLAKQSASRGKGGGKNHGPVIPPPPPVPTARPVPPRLLKMAAAAHPGNDPPAVLRRLAISHLAATADGPLGPRSMRANDLSLAFRMEASDAWSNVTVPQRQPAAWADPREKLKASRIGMLLVDVAGFRVEEQGPANVVVALDEAGLEAAAAQALGLPVPLSDEALAVVPVPVPGPLGGGAAGPAAAGGFGAPPGPGGAAAGGHKAGGPAGARFGTPGGGDSSAGSATARELQALAATVFPMNTHVHVASRAAVSILAIAPPNPVGPHAMSGAQLGIALSRDEGVRSLCVDKPLALIKGVPCFVQMPYKDSHNAFQLDVNRLKAMAAQVTGGAPPAAGAAAAGGPGGAAGAGAGGPGSMPPPGAGPMGGQGMQGPPAQRQGGPPAAMQGDHPLSSRLGPGPGMMGPQGMMQAGGPGQGIPGGPQGQQGPMLVAQGPQGPVLVQAAAVQQAHPAQQAGAGQQGGAGAEVTRQLQKLGTVAFAGFDPVSTLCRAAVMVLATAVSGPAGPHSMPNDQLELALAAKEPGACGAPGALQLYRSVPCFKRGQSPALPNVLLVQLDIADLVTRAAQASAQAPAAAAAQQAQAQAHAAQVQAQAQAFQQQQQQQQAAAAQAAAAAVGGLQIRGGQMVGAEQGMVPVYAAAPGDMDPSQQQGMVKRMVMVPNAGGGPGGPPMMGMPAQAMHPGQAFVGGGPSSSHSQGSGSAAQHQQQQGPPGGGAGDVLYAVVSHVYASPEPLPALRRLAAHHLLGTTQGPAGPHSIALFPLLQLLQGLAPEPWALLSQQLGSNDAMTKLQRLVDSPEGVLLPVRGMDGTLAAIALDVNALQRSAAASGAISSASSGSMAGVMGGAGVAGGDGSHAADQQQAQQQQQ